MWVLCLAAQCSNLSSHRIGFNNQPQLQLTFSTPLTALNDQHTKERKKKQVKKKENGRKQWLSRSCKTIRQHCKQDQLSLLARRKIRKKSNQIKEALTRKDVNVWCEWDKLRKWESIWQKTWGCNFFLVTLTRKCVTVISCWLWNVSVQSWFVLMLVPWSCQVMSHFKFNHNQFPKLHHHYSSVTNSTEDHSSEDEVMIKPRRDWWRKRNTQKASGNRLTNR